MKKLDVIQMENVNGGEVDWCAVAWGVVDVGGAAMMAGATFSGGWAVLGYYGIWAAAEIWC